MSDKWRALFALLDSGSCETLSLLFLCLYTFFPSFLIVPSFNFNFFLLLLLLKHYEH
jgi:hypothetical protein